MPDSTERSDSPAKDQRFPYDDRPVHPQPSEEHPLETLAGRGQTEGTPMGLGRLAWIPIIVVGIILLLIGGSYVLSLLK